MKLLTNPTFWMIVEAALLVLFWPTVLIVALASASSEPRQSPAPAPAQVATDALRR